MGFERGLAGPVFVEQELGRIAHGLMEIVVEAPGFRARRRKGLLQHVPCLLLEPGLDLDDGGDSDDFLSHVENADESTALRETLLTADRSFRRPRGGIG